MTTKLDVFNDALVEMGERELTDTGENCEAARTLVRRWSSVVNYCLAQGSWNFAMEEIQADADTGVDPEFGYSEVFVKPSDWKRTYAVSADENFRVPLIDYIDEVDYWSSDVTPIYIKYVSNDTGLGFELTRWTDAFARYVALEMASRVCFKLTSDKSLTEEIKKDRKKALTNAKNQDSMNEAQPKFAPPGRWVSARQGSHVWNKTGSSIEE